VRFALDIASRIADIDDYGSFIAIVPAFYNCVNLRVVSLVIASCVH